MRTKEFGSVEVPNTVFFNCSSCGDRSLDSDQAQKVTAYVDKAVRTAISSLPINEFVSASTASGMLNLSKQAFAKNNRINRGFIYAHEIDGRRYYVRRSVEAYKLCKDGRVSLPAPAPAKKIQQINPITVFGLWSASQGYILNREKGLAEFLRMKTPGAKVKGTIVKSKLPKIIGADAETSSWGKSSIARTASIH
ncbi:MAG: hypothetical protein Q8M35_05540 [Pseudohongiella sp.]|nr:hypothetical protein [Pseudohongiella sp.]